MKQHIPHTLFVNQNLQNNLQIRFFKNGIIELLGIDII
jgi:hypothetical protein